MYVNFALFVFTAPLENATALLEELYVENLLRKGKKKIEGYMRFACRE
jgi:hypothetical protein